MSDKNSQDKAARLKAALRENLKRRKAQARGRGASGARERPAGDGEGADSSNGGRD